MVQSRVTERGAGGRRRDSGAPSARSLLLTVLGEFVLPQTAPVWTGALVAALREVGVEEKAARQALSRTAVENLLASERTGRRVRWRLTAEGTELLVEGTHRIYGFGRGVQDWDGRWLVLAITVPEAQRQLRHSLRTRLTWAGLGSPMPGLWVTPDVTKEKEVTAIIDSLGVAAFSFTGPFGQVGDQQRVVSEAWRLEDLEDRYREFLTRFAGTGRTTPVEAFRGQISLVQHWRHFPFLDPLLPAALLPRNWPGPAAAHLFHRQHDRWHLAAQRYWQTLMVAAETRL